MVILFKAFWISVRVLARRVLNFKRAGKGSLLETHVNVSEYWPLFVGG